MFFLAFLTNYRFIFFFYVTFFLFFLINSFHAITEEVCVGMCFSFFLIFLLVYLTKSGNISLQKAWYKLFLEGFDIVNLSSALIFKGFFLIFSSKHFRVIFDFRVFYSLFFSLFLSVIYMVSKDIFSLFSIYFVESYFFYNMSKTQFKDVFINTNYLA